jgi:hypothetical protein
MRDGPFNGLQNFHCFRPPVLGQGSVARATIGGRFNSERSSSWTIPSRLPDGLEGLVSKHRDRPYRAGRSPHWVKVKNRQHHAFSRVMGRFYDNHSSHPHYQTLGLGDSGFCNPPSSLNGSF